MFKYFRIKKLINKLKINESIIFHKDSFYFEISRDAFFKLIQNTSPVSNVSVAQIVYLEMSNKIKNNRDYFDEFKKIRYKMIRDGELDVYNTYTSFYENTNIIDDVLFSLVDNFILEYPLIQNLTVKSIQLFIDGKIELNEISEVFSKPNSLFQKERVSLLSNTHDFFQDVRAIYGLNNENKFKYTEAYYDNKKSFSENLKDVNVVFSDIKTYFKSNKVRLNIENEVVNCNIERLIDWNVFFDCFYLKIPNVILDSTRYNTTIIIINDKLSLFLFDCEKNKEANAFEYSCVSTFLKGDDYV